MELDDLSFEIIEDPEMIIVGQRLIMQGDELLDITDLSDLEKRKAVKTISECWDILKAVKFLKDAFFKITRDYRDGKKVPLKKDLGLKSVFVKFLEDIAKVLNHLLRLLALSALNKIVFKSYLGKYKELMESLHLLDVNPVQRSLSLIEVVRQGQSDWIEDFTRLYQHVYLDKDIDGCFKIKEGPSLENGRVRLEFFLSGGGSVEAFMENTWEFLVDFCEDFLGYAIQLRCYEIVDHLEVIPREERDSAYPRRFKPVFRGASPQSGETGP